VTGLPFTERTGVSNKKSESGGDQKKSLTVAFSTVPAFIATIARISLASSFLI
jgi:hypothetical protein